MPGVRHWAGFGDMLLLGNLVESEGTVEEPLCEPELPSHGDVSGLGQCKKETLRFKNGREDCLELHTGYLNGEENI